MEKILCICLHRSGEQISPEDPIFRGVWESTRYISITDIDRAIMEIKENENTPFGLPLLDTIVRGDLFWVVYDQMPGRISIKVMESSVSDYLMILGNEKILSLFEWSDSARGIEPYIRTRYRDKKINDILC